MSVADISTAETAGPGPGYQENPAHFVEFEPSPKRVRVSFAGEDIVDTTTALILYESRHVPVYYFPRADVAMERLVATDHSTHCPFKGDANYFSIEVNGQTAENAVWTYELPFDEVVGIKDYVALYWKRVDHWYEEDEEVFVHAHSPRVRIDILDSSRFLFETNLPTRYYIPREDVGAELLPSDTQTQCPYKGAASYHSVKVGDTVHEDIVWYYPDPVHESAQIKDYLCFFNEKVDAVYVDGVEQEKPKTKWS